jgi:hypothetical protein
VILFGYYWSHIYLDAKVIKGDKPKITASLSMQCFGYDEQVLPGEIYLLIMVAGKIRIAGSVDGGIKAYGNF